MLMGAIVGDFVGSRFERHNTSRTDFVLLHPHCVFTDDTVLTVATAEAMATDSDYGSAYRRWALPRRVHLSRILVAARFDREDGRGNSSVGQFEAAGSLLLYST